MENLAREHNNAAKFTFFYLLSLVALISMSTSVGVVLFQIINKQITDTLNPNSGIFDPSGLKFAIASIIISTPIYYLITRLINQSLFRGSLDKEAAARRWLSYLILFISSVVMIGWLISVIFSFLDGELTLKFILKALVAVGISAVIFSYYLYDVRRERVTGVKDKVVAAFSYLSLAVVLISLVSAFFFVESPIETRQRRHDQAITQNFDMIDSALNSYYSETFKLPANLMILATDKHLLNEANLKDPATGQPYAYHVIKDKTYELCATFEMSNRAYNPQLNYDNTRWPHDTGYQCLKQELYVPLAPKSPDQPVPVKPLPKQ